MKWFSVVRVLGLALVLTYHLFPEALPAGFFGVDVFFVFSGYLITSLIIEEFRREGRFRLPAFFERRFYRIYPPLVTALLLTLPFTLFISADFTAGVGRQVAGALGGVTNYYEILSGGSYEAKLLPHLFVHTWSLAIEIHFYIAWGLFCFGLTRFALKFVHAGKRARFLKTAIISASCVLAVGAFWRMRVLYGQSPEDPSAAYFSTLSHSFPFFAGAAASALCGIGLSNAARFRCRKWKVISASAMAVCGAGIIVLARTQEFSGAGTYSFGFPVVVVLAACLICAARILSDAAEGADEPKPLTIAADLSYSVYLFHWPLYIVFSNAIANQTAAAVLTLMFSFAFAALTFYVVEPLTRGKRKVWQKPRKPMDVFAAFAVIAGLSISCGVVARSPSVTSIESTFAAGYIYQDAENIEGLFAMAEAIDVEQFPPSTPAKAGRLEFSAMTPSPSPAPRTLDTPAPSADVSPETTPTPSPSLSPSLSPSISPSPSFTPGPSPSGGPATEQTPPSSTGTETSPISAPPPASERPQGEIPAGVSIIGDSVMLGARRTVGKVIPDSVIDAKGSRQFEDGYNLMMQWQDEGSLRECVVIALGTNGTGKYQQLLGSIIDGLALGHRLILVTPYDGRATETWHSYKTCVYMRTLPEQYPFVTVADWAAVIRDKPALQGADKVHFGGIAEAEQLFAECILEAVETAMGKESK